MEKTQTQLASAQTNTPDARTTNNRQSGQPRRAGGMDSTRSPQAGSARSQQASSHNRTPMRKRPKERYRDKRDLPRPRRLVPIERPNQPTDESATKDTVKIVPLGGLGEVGRNMSVLEYKNDIIIIDVGFGFAEDDMPGIDYTLPNISYLDGKQDRIRGIILTHGHMDHVGGLPYLIRRLGNPPIYAAELTRAIAIKRHQEFPHLPELDITLVYPKEHDTFRLGEFEIECFHVNHNIPDDTALIITTPAGRIVHTADFKFDPKPLNEEPADLDFIKSIGDRGVTMLMCDSTNAEKEGKAVSESVIQDNLELIFKEANGMLIIGTFSSMINRVQQLVTLSEKYGRKVIFDGFSLKTNIEVARELNKLRIKKETQIPISDIDRYPRNQVTLIGTGAQGEGRAVLMRIASGEHRYTQLKKGDSVIFSSSAIPGNERTVQRLKDLFYRSGVRVYHSGMMDVHASGHANKEDLRLMMQLIRPRFLMPIHGQYSMMVNEGYIGQEEGIPEANVIIADNGSIIHLTPNAWWIDKKTAPSDIVMVDGLGIGDIGNVVIRDRQVLAEDGMFVVVALIDSKTGRVRGSPDIISRGFVYLKENKELLMQVRKKVKFIVEHKATRPINWIDLKDIIRDEVGLFLFQKTERRPMVLPVVIEI